MKLYKYCNIEEIADFEVCKSPKRVEIPDYETKPLIDVFESELLKNTTVDC